MCGWDRAHSVARTTTAGSGPVRSRTRGILLSPRTLRAGLRATGALAADDGSTIPEGASANSLDVREDGLVVVAAQAPGTTTAHSIS